MAQPLEINIDETQEVPKMCLWIEFGGKIEEDFQRNLKIHRTFKNSRKGKKNIIINTK